MRQIRVPADVRFEGKVERITESGCWVWMGNIDRKGYGHFYDPAMGRQVLAHRWAYERFRGAISAATLDHLCRVTCCVNPWHLEPATHRENILRSPTAIATRNASRDRCPYGHEYREIIAKGKKRRRCMVCQRKAVQKCMRRIRAKAG